jgi:hypothetical protein
MLWFQPFLAGVFSVEFLLKPFQNFTVRSPWNVFPRALLVPCTLLHYPCPSLELSLVYVLLPVDPVSTVLNTFLGAL